jgi:hypothetical protein
LLCGGHPLTSGDEIVIPTICRRVTRDKGHLYHYYQRETVRLRLRQRQVGRCRGLPSNSRILCIIDACRSGSMLGLPYIYDPEHQRLWSTLSTSVFSHCWCLSAAPHYALAFSTIHGSPFTRYLHDLLMRVAAPLSITDVYQLWSQQGSLPVGCQPVITTTTTDPYQALPLTSMIAPHR